MGVLNPGGLLFAALLGVLVLLYLWERLRRRIEVPSLLLWRSVPEEVVQRRRFQPEWLLLLQALLLLLLIAGLARPYVLGRPVSQRARHYVLVVDISASMQAREGRRTRFETARTLIEETVRQFLPGDAVMLITAAARPEVVVDFTPDPHAVLDAVRALEPVDTGTQLSAAVALARRVKERDPQHTEILLFTDLPASALEPPDRVAVRRFAVGESSDNVAVSALQIHQGPFDDPAQARAVTMVRNFSYAEKHGVLTLSVGDSVVSRTGFTIAGRGARSFLSGDFPGPGLVTAAIDIDDALAADNRAHGWVRPRRALHLLVVSPPSSLLDEIRQMAGALPGMQVTHIVPGAYTGTAHGEVDVAVFHRVAPAAPPVGAVYIYPPPGNPMFPVEGQTADVDVLDWNHRHPTLHGIEPVIAAPIAATQIVRPPAGSQPLLWSRGNGREIQLALAMEEAGRRRACVAFDLERERLLGNDNLTLLLFFLNLVAWAAGDEEGAPAVLATGDVYEVPSAPEAVAVEVTEPRGRTASYAPGTKYVELSHAGLYRVRTNGHVYPVIANLADAGESDIGRPAKERPPLIPTAPVVPDRRRNEIARWLYLVATALLLVEWLAWKRRQWTT
jgi:hypothetical protein